MINQLGATAALAAPHVAAEGAHSRSGARWTFLRRRRGHASATAFLDTLERTTRVGVRSVEPELEEESLQWLRRHGEREYSFVDATSFALMRKLGLREALAFDCDFAAAGFVELRS